MRGWLWRLRALVRRGRLTAERREELQFHLDMEIEEGLRRGLSPDEARRRARLRAGALAEGLEPTREALGFRWLDGAALDLRHAVRALTRSRGFGAIAVLVLAASVAISTLIFCLVDGVVLRPLPYREPSRLVRIFDETSTIPRFPMSIGHFLHVRQLSRSIESLALYTGHDMELTAAEGRSRRLTGVAITSDFFAVLGRAPALGRAFAEADLRKDSRNVIISHRLWQDGFNGDPAIIGKSVRLDREPWTIVGVAPAGFQHVGGEYRSPLQGETVDIWLPLGIDLPPQGLRNWHFTNAIARIGRGSSLAQVREELLVLAAAYRMGHPGNDWTMRPAPLLDEVTGRSRPVLWLLLGAGGLVLLLSCANIAGLSLARAVARRPELALRQALGAGRWQLLRVGLCENLLIGVVGALLGILLAAAGAPLLRQLLPADFPRAHEVAFTGGAALVATAIALGTALVAGLLPGPARGGPATQARVTAGRDSRRLRTVLVVGELALAGVLCGGSLFLLRSYQQIGARDHGFRAAGVLTFKLSVPGSDNARVSRTLDDIAARLAELPGVAAAGATTNLPWSGYDENTSFGIVGRAVENDDLNARFQAATPGYFEAAGMRLLDGRFFERARETPDGPVAVMVNDALVARYFPDGHAVGQRLDVFGKEREIVGVVAGIKDFPADLDVKPGFWFVLGQQPFASVSYAVRAVPGVDPASLTAAAARAVHDVDSELALSDVRTLERRASGALAARRFALSLFETFAALALVLSAAGIYGLLAYIVQQRRRELVIRVALGANRAQLGRLILGDGLRMAAIAALVCLLLVPAGGQLLRAFLFNVKPLDLATVVGAPLALLAAALLASLGPARSATRSDPSMVLRQD